MRERRAFWGRTSGCGWGLGPGLRPRWGTGADRTSRRATSLPRPQALGTRREPRAPGLTECAARPSSGPTHPMPLTALMYRLSCSFTEQFMGMPVTCDNTPGEGLASLEPQGHLPTPLSLVRSRGRAFRLICLCPGVPSTRPKPQKVNLCFPNGFFSPRPRGGRLESAGLSPDGKILTLPVCRPERTLPRAERAERGVLVTAPPSTLQITQNSAHCAR